MFKNAKANIAAAVILCVLVVGGLLGFVFLYDFPDYYTAEIVNLSTEGFVFEACEGYDKDRIKEGDDFKFTITLTGDYVDSDITVKVNDEVVELYEETDYYWIKEVTSDLKIEVSGLTSNNV